MYSRIFCIFIYSQMIIYIMGKNKLVSTIPEEQKDLNVIF